jgi:tetratricopeptide (TPR) repeat protein
MKSTKPTDGIESDPDDRFIRDVYGTRLKALKNTDWDRCPPAEILLDFHQGNLKAARRRKTEDHVIVCPFCLDALEALRRAEESAPEHEKITLDWSSVEKALNKRVYMSLGPVAVQDGERSSAPDRNTVRHTAAGRTWRTFWVDIFKPRHLVYSGAFAVTGVLILYSSAYLSRGPYFSMARMDPERLGRLRSEVTLSDFTEGMNRYEQGKYNQAVVLLDRAIRTHPADYTARYYLGLSRLAAAEKRLPGLPYRFDAAEVEKGIFDLQKALLLARDNAYYQEDCLWYLGKAFLMRGDKGRARDEFNAILRMQTSPPSRREEAEKMISALR